VNLVIEAIDINAVVAKVDVDALVQRVNVEGIVDRVDIERIVDRVDIERIVDRVDIERIVDRVDIERIVDRVDIDRIVDRMDIDAIVQRVDINAIVQRVDINAIVDNMDIDSLVERTELGAIIAKSTTGVFTEVLDVIRSQGVGLDDFCARWTNRILRRPASSLPLGPGMAPGATSQATAKSNGGRPQGSTTPSASMPSSNLTVDRQGQYAGAISRLAAFAIDIGVLWGVYVGGTAALSFAVQLLTGHSYDVSKHPVVAVSVLGAWSFFYFAYQWAVAGRTLGMGILGIRVVLADGRPNTPRAALIRTASLPLSIAAFFLGFLGILTNRERRAWHDRFAGTAVVYAWDARAARLRWLAERDAPSSAAPRTA
jgi:uncharacterized RDD family membrane protein YckC